MSGPIGTVGIIGGGLAGLTAALRLARRGVRVRLFEARAKLGGCCATTTIAGYTFNDGALYVALPGILDHAFAQLGLERERLLPLRRISATQTSHLPDGSRVVFGAGTDVRRVDADGRSSRVELSGLIERWQPLVELATASLAVRPFSYARFLSRAWRYLPRLRGTVADELARFFPDVATRSAMAGLVLYTGLPAERTPALQMLGLVGLFTDGFHVPARGMGQIPACLGAALASTGAEIHTDRRVVRIRTAAGRVAALELEDGETVPLDAVIATVSGMHTCRLLGEAAPRGMRRKAGRAPLSHRAVAVQLGLRNRIDAPSHSISVLPWIGEQRDYFAPTAAGLRYYHYSVPTVTLPELAPAGGSVVEMFPPIRQDLPVDAWDGAAVDAMATAAIVELGRRHRLDVVTQRVLGPVQYRDELGLFAGAIYGLAPVVEPTALFGAVTAVPGLFQAGQTAYPGYGVVSAAMSGIFAADALLRSAEP